MLRSPAPATASVTFQDTAIATPVAMVAWIP